MSTTFSNKLRATFGDPCGDTFLVSKLKLMLDTIISSHGPIFLGTLAMVLRITIEQAKLFVAELVLSGHVRKLDSSETASMGLHKSCELYEAVKR